MLLPLKQAALEAALAALVALAATCGPAGCSLHYDQQVDGQTLDLEVMRPVPVNRQSDKEEP